MMSGMSFAPYVPSQPEVVRKMLEVARVGPEDVVYDLGCGDGRILVMAVKRFGVKKAVGYELREDLYKSTLRKIERQNLKERISLMNGDLFKADISDATVITLYLSASDNEHLKTKLTKEARPGTRVVSHDFRMNGWQASESEITAYIGYIYMYVIPDAFSSPKKKKSMAST
jgi:ubiquinone/menaquinone biosynthesis C-methylase UbiE